MGAIHHKVIFCERLISLTFVNSKIMKISVVLCENKLFIYKIMKKTFLKGFAIAALVVLTSCANKNVDGVDFDIRTNSNGETELVVEETRIGVTTKNTYTGNDAVRKLKELANDGNETIRDAAKEAQSDFKAATDKAEEELRRAANKTENALEKAGDDIEKGLNKAGDAIEDAYQDVKKEVKKATN